MGLRCKDDDYHGVGDDLAGWRNRATSMQEVLKNMSVSEAPMMPLVEDLSQLRCHQSARDESQRKYRSARLIREHYMKIMPQMQRLDAESPVSSCASLLVYVQQRTSIA